MMLELIAPLAISVAGFGLSAGNTLYNWRRNAGTDNQKLWGALAGLTTDVALLKKQGDLFWGLVEQQMAKALIRPTHIELDELLEKLVADEPLTSEQEARLMEMLHVVAGDKDEMAGFRAMGATILAIRLARQTPPLTT